MSGYDPRRIRPNPAAQNSTPPEDAAPVDTLLGPSPEVTAEQEKPAFQLAPDMPEVSTEPPVPLRRVELRPSFWLQLSPLLAAVAAVLLFWLIRRTKKSR